MFPTLETRENYQKQPVLNQSFRNATILSTKGSSSITDPINNLYISIVSLSIEYETRESSGDVPERSLALERSDYPPFAVYGGRNRMNVDRGRTKWHTSSRVKSCSSRVRRDVVGRKPSTPLC